MTTDYIAGLHYFCVDVETSALRTWEGNLLTLGCTVVDDKGNIVDDFYVRIKNDLHPSWYNENVPSTSPTQTWWREQNHIAKMEAYLDPACDRHSIGVAAQKFNRFVLGYGKDWEERRFVSDPDKFDWVWTDHLLAAANLPDPFFYHGIDMYSVRLGAAAQRRTGKNKGKIDLKKRHEKTVAHIPHHALSDSFALAKDLCEFLDKQPISLDAPASDPIPVEPEPEVVAPDEEPVPTEETESE